MKIAKKLLVTAVAVLLCFTAFAACSTSAIYGNAPGEEEAKSFVPPTGRKIIYEASFTVKTKDIKSDAAVIENSLEEDEWFDSVKYSGNYVYFSARVKSSRLDEYIKSISDSVGADNVEDFSKKATDISHQYYDMQGQIDALETERARLIDLMSSDETTMSDLILINTRLSEVELDLQRLRGSLYLFDSLIEYSTVEITVEKITYYWIIGVIIPCLFVAGAAAAIVIALKTTKKKKSAADGK